MIKNIASILTQLSSINHQDQPLQADQDQTEDSHSQLKPVLPKSYRALHDAQSTNTKQRVLSPHETLPHTQRSGSSVF